MRGWSGMALCLACVPEEPVEPVSSQSGPAVAAQPIGAGLPCPDGVGCGEGLSCRYALGLDAFLCTATCATFDDCLAVGFGAGCCMPPVGVQSEPLCVSRVWGVCPPLGPGEACPGGEGCRDDLTCWYLVERNQLVCTDRCELDEDCIPLGFEDGCCAPFRAANTRIETLCVPRALGGCE